MGEVLSSNDDDDARVVRLISDKHDKRLSYTDIMICDISHGPYKILYEYEFSEYHILRIFTYVLYRINRMTRHLFTDNSSPHVRRLSCRLTGMYDI